AADRADQIGAADEPDFLCRKAQHRALLQGAGDRTRHGHFEPVEDPCDAERDDDECVEPSPRQPVEPPRNIGFDDAREIRHPPPTLAAVSDRTQGSVKVKTMAGRYGRTYPRFRYPGSEVLPMKQFGIGQPVRRVEDRRFITGRGNYVDDINRPRQAHAYMLRSPHAHARIRRIDAAAARSAPGVLGVFTGEDLARDGIGTIPCLSAVTNRDGSPSALPPHPAIARDRVRHVGDTAAMVVAESAAAARDASELIAVDYEPLPAAVDTAHALDAGQPQVWDEAPGNLCFDWEVGDRAAVERAMTG